MVQTRQVQSTGFDSLTNQIIIRIACCAVEQGSDVVAVATVYEKSATEPKKKVIKQHKSKTLLKGKQTTLVSKFNARTLNSRNQMLELEASAQKFKIDIICVKEHRFHHDDVELKYH